jgi:hypothetical protein
MQIYIKSETGFHNSISVFFIYYLNKYLTFSFLRHIINILEEILDPNGKTKKNYEKDAPINNNTNSEYNLLFADDICYLKLC